MTAREELRCQLHDGADALRVALTPRQSDRLLDYVALLAKWNAVYNLTAVRDPRRMVAAHLLDCLAALPEAIALGADQGARILDVGSGAGLPGIVWAIMLDRADRPPAPLVLIDAVEKKTAFQRQACTELGLHNVQCVHARVERWQGAPFDLVCSRAYASLSDFVDGTRHLLAGTGRWLAMKGEPPAGEIARLPEHAAVERVVPLVVPMLDDASRCVVVLRPTIQAPDTPDAP